MKPAAEVTFTPVEILTRSAKALLVRQYAPTDLLPLVAMYRVFEPKRVAQGFHARCPPHNAVARPVAAQIARPTGLGWGAGGCTCDSLSISDAAVEFTIFVHQDFRRIGLARR